eukprot:TRINITY_DN1055_c0_g1_i1.p3 TRINITY_DN1055_c0_g1~~TRINITY_DN1055_c0_g1_i1.p3  ORF type:complete len:184 (-),score=46.65 TRINITY_DN1055_c0_g1_i1:323-874(-)
MSAHSSVDFEHTGTHHRRLLLCVAAMARVRSTAATVFVVCACALLLSTGLQAFVGHSQPASRAALVARAAAEPSKTPASTDFSLDFDVVAEDDKEAIGKMSAIIFGVLGFFFVPIFKGLTCGLLFAAIAYFAANGSITSFVGKSDSAKEYASTASTVESVAGGLGGYGVKAYNFVVSKVKSAK